QIKDVDEQKAYFDEGRTMLLTSLRNATQEEIAEEKQRRWWAKHGRDVWELKEDDILNVNGAIRTVYHVDENKVYFYEVSEIYTLDIMKGSGTTIVVCFAEDRKDLESEEE